MSRSARRVACAIVTARRTAQRAALGVGRPSCPGGVELGQGLDRSGWGPAVQAVRGAAPAGDCGGDERSVGVTEARSPDGDFFGPERLVDLISRNLAGGLPTPETMRRVVRALLAHQQVG